MNSPFKNEIPLAGELVDNPKRICDQSLFSNIGTRLLFLKWKFHTNYTLTMITTCSESAKLHRYKVLEKTLCWQQGSNLQPCIPRWQTTILTAFFQLSLLGTIILSPDLFGPGTILWSGVTMWLRLISTQTTPAPLLGLQHNATLPGAIRVFLYFLLDKFIAVEIFNFKRTVKTRLP